MAERNEEVMEMVRGEIAKNPGAKLADLYQRAREIDPTITQMSTRQFYASYPLQVKRSRPGSKAKAGGGKKTGRAAQPARAAKSRGAAPEPDRRDGIRRVVLAFARDLAEAESRAEVVRVLSGVDTYVEQIEELVSQRDAAGQTKETRS